MGTITAITAQKRNKDRVNIHLDGEYAFSLAAITAAYLRTGQELSSEKIDELRTADAYERAKEAALNYISYRPRSEWEVRRKLREKEIPDEAIDKAFERLRELDLLDDLAFAKYWVEQREAFKPRGARALHAELRKKGVPRTIIEQVVTAVDEDNAARRAAEKKTRRLAHLPEEKFRRKLSGFLQRRGFNYAITREVTDEMWQHVSSERVGDDE